MNNEYLERLVVVEQRCKQKKEITRYQLQSVHFIYTEYKKLCGNSSVDKIMEEIKD